jgi:23S rRNA pseudouridine1911/1915/1917 synthase
MFARTEAVKFALQKAWSSVTKKYQAIVEGTPSPSEGTFRSELAETDSLLVHPTRAPRADSKIAVTHYRVLRSTKIYAQVELTLQTGRKNQIRVQLAEAGHPIVGDQKYGARTDPARRLALHACELRFRHPLTGEALEFKNALPTKLRALVANVSPALPGAQSDASSTRRRVEP